MQGMTVARHPGVRMRTYNFEDYEINNGCSGHKLRS